MVECIYDKAKITEPSHLRREELLLSCYHYRREIPHPLGQMSIYIVLSPHHEECEYSRHVKRELSAGRRFEWCHVESHHHRR